MFKLEVCDAPVELPVPCEPPIQLSPVGQLLLEASLRNMEWHGTDPPPEG